MSSVMIRVSMVLAVAAGLAATAAGVARAETDLGQACFTFAGFSDGIRFTITQPSGSAAIFELHFRWRGASYQIVGAGVATDSLLQPGKVDVAVVGTHNTSLFGGNKICSLFAVLNPSAGLSGPVDVTCTGSSGAPFTTSGTLNNVACTSALEELPGPSVGE